MVRKVRGLIGTQGIISRPMSAELQSQLIALGKVIRMLRHSRGISQEELADIASIDRSYIGQVERGTRNLSFSNLSKIATALGVTVSDLTKGI